MATPVSTANEMKKRFFAPVSRPAPTPAHMRTARNGFAVPQKQQSAAGPTPPGLSPFHAALFARADANRASDIKQKQLDRQNQMGVVKQSGKNVLQQQSQKHGFDLEGKKVQFGYDKQGKEIQFGYDVEKSRLENQDIAKREAQARREGLGAEILKGGGNNALAQTIYNSENGMPDIGSYRKPGENPLASKMKYEDTGQKDEEGNPIYLAVDETGQRQPTTMAVGSAGIIQPEPGAGATTEPTPEQKAIEDTQREAYRQQASAAYKRVGPNKARDLRKEFDKVYKRNDLDAINLWMDQLREADPDAYAALQYTFY